MLQSGRAGVHGSGFAWRVGFALTSPEYVTESLEAVMRHGFDGAVLSWNIMEAPVNHIECLSETK